MSTTLDTSHFDKSWLKLDALENMYPMLVAADTSHFDRSALKADALENRVFMLVTADTSHSPIAPCSSLEQSPLLFGDHLMHSLTASFSFSADFGLNLNTAVARLRKYR